MKRLAVVIAGLAVTAAVLTALAVAATSGGARGMGGSVKKKPKLAALPANVKERHRWVIGVKCDFPPFGFINVQGKNDGYDVQVARRFATLAFGKPNRISLTCVTTPSRIPTLTASKVDIIISTLTWTAARAQQIDFSVPYYSATGRLLVPNNSSITSVKGIHGKNIVTTRGALYATW